MFSKQPKGLIPAALANMGERFGFYTMMAILVLFLQAKYGLKEQVAGVIYSVFYFSIYILAFVGGLIADKTRNYKKTILWGLIVMTIGYITVSLPFPAVSEYKYHYLVITLLGLFIIAFGNGLFKGNLQALVGQMYDNETYSKMRDSGFSIFYMFINIGAFFAPFAAAGVRNWWLSIHGFKYNSELPGLCHSYLNGTISEEGLKNLPELANQVSLTGNISDIATFVKDYISVFSTGFNYAFIVSVLAMIVSLIIFLTYKKYFPDVKKIEKQQSTSQQIPEMSKEEIKQRIYALLAVYFVVIFFWFSFHQNGLTLTYFARDYTLLKIGSLNITAEQFQSVNPFFIVLLTPVVVAFFAWLRKKNLEPSTPRKIAIGMFIAGCAYLLMTIASINLPPFSEIQGKVLPDEQKVTPFLLICAYFILTVAELFISPLGISFVSKVAPPKYQGLMQGGWLGATAIGNQLLFIGALLYVNAPLWITWLVFVIVCFISMATMLVMLKWLEKVAR
ncbi:MAG: peptide MFS transporter [Bacteroidales bacterium]|nr:peptide MFS transporter [Bacteroidales bacterium]